MFNSNSRTYFQIVLSKPQLITQKYQNITKCANQLNISSFFRKPRNANLNSLHKNNRFLESKPVYKQHKCSFHTSSRRPIPPIILALMKPITKVTAAVAGRTVRKWYRGMDSAKKKALIATIKRHWYIPVGIVGSVVVYGGVFYYSHIVETPITGRKRFVMLTYDQILKIAEEEAKNHEEAFKGKMFGPDDPETHRVVNVMMRLLNANTEMNRNLAFDQWKIFVVNSPLCNAFAMPNGNVFVFRGMLDLATTDDELAIIMGHEVAHAVLSHSIEELSQTAFISYFTILILAAIWCILPNDGVAAITHWFYNKVIQLTTQMPHSRKLEKEADKVGLMFAAKACFDVRVGSMLWKKMDLKSKIIDGDVEIPEWMSTHPDNESRAEHLDFLLPEAIKWRDSMKCPVLPSTDPRNAVIKISEKVDDMIIARRAGQNLTQVTKRI